MKFKKQTARERATQREVERTMPGDEITSSPIPVGLVNDVRRGVREVADIPWVNPSNHDALQENVTTRNENRFDRSNPEHVREYADILRRTRDNPEAQRELAEYRRFELQNDVMASPFALAPFQVVDLSHDELPLIERPQSRNLNRFTVRTVSVEGRTREDQWKTTKSVETLELEALGTDKIEYPILDIQTGDVSVSDAVDEALRYDFDMKLDTLALANIDAAQTASGLRDLLNIHPKVVAANIPDTNYLDLDTAHPGNTGVLTIEKLKTLLNHVALLGAANGFGAAESVTISTIILSPQNMRDPWDFTNLVSGFSGGDAVEPKETVPTGVREQIFANGMFSSAWGFNWSWTPNSQIAKGRMYVFMTQPLGWLFTKQVYDQVLRWDENNSPSHAEINQGQVMFRRVLSFYVPDLWQHRVVIIDL